MLKAILYKEWLKVRWAYFILMAVTLLVTIYIYLNLAQIIKFNNERVVWYDVIFRSFIYYSAVNYIPLITGITLGLTQFIPEVISSRLKLSFHLPIDENKVLIQKILFGCFLQLTLSIFLLILLSISTLAFFPRDVLYSMLITTFPLILAGFLGYFLVSFIIVEHSWIRRIILIVIGYGLIELFTEQYFYNLYEKSIGSFVLLCIATSILLLFSGYRFRRGVR